MAFAATTDWEIQTGGADGTTGNGGGFDPANANMATDLAVATQATSDAPVATSASYTFIARDVGHWLFVKSGTNWTPGWYQIASVAGGAATLSAAEGAAVDLVSLRPSTASGCSQSAGSLTGGTWSIDYSQTAAAGITYTDAVVDAVTNTNYTSAAFPVGPNIVGNVVAFSAGTLWTVQRAQIVSVAGTVATCDKALGTVSGFGGTGKLGGALASPGQAGALHVGGNDLFIKSGTYSITSASLNVAGGCPSLAAGVSTANATKVVGYGSIRGDDGTKPLLQASGIATFTIMTLATNSGVWNVSFDGASLTASKGLSTLAGVYVVVYGCEFANCTNSGQTSTQGTQTMYCEYTNCLGGAANGGIYLYCTSYANTSTGFTGGTGSVFVGCFSVNNTGATSDGFQFSGSGAVVSCTAYGNGRDGFRGSANTQRPEILVNCLATNNIGYGFTDANIEDLFYLNTCAGYSNTSGNVDLAKITLDRISNFITLQTTPFIDAAGGNFALNETKSGGAELIAFPETMPGIPTNPNRMIGAAATPESVTEAGGSVLRRRVTRRC